MRMSPELPVILQELAYEREAQAYLRSLPPEHFMEVTDQSHQGGITLASFALLHAARPEVQYFNELLVQYPRKRRRKPGQVVPDNMVVLTTQRLRARTSYNVPLEPAPPFWVLEYVSKESQRKDYEDSFKKYERELKVPYYLTFYPDNQEMTLYHHNGKKYVSVKPNEHGRCALPELELEIGLLDGWVRYWFRGELLPLPADLQSKLAQALHRADEEKRRADEEKRRADELRQQLAAAERELAKLRSRPNAKKSPGE
jgi:Uma2 family endonuclease